MPTSPAEIVVVFEPDAAPGALQTWATRRAAGALAGLSLAPLAPRAAEARAQAARRAETPAQQARREGMSLFHSTPVVGRSVDSALDELRSLPGVATAYWKPGVQNPLAPPLPGPEAPVAALGIRPRDFRALQGYLDRAPHGVGAEAAWRLPGGRGAGVRVIDIEGGWQLTHTDLRDNAGGLLAGTAYPERGWRDHGTAVLGELGGDLDGLGVSGLCPDAVLSCVSHGALGSSRAIRAAAGFLRPGDVLLLEMHRPGPRFAFADRQDQRGFIAVEWWPDDLLAIQDAVARGIVVVEAAGNGAEDLDDALYDTPGPAFPAGWRNPFAVGEDSGAIVVGAGAPPSGHFGPDRSRLDFSNWGRRVDTQGWGRGVVTTGYGHFYADPEDPADEDYWYTHEFSGTSSASPIVAGVVACVQGIAKAQGRVLTPDELRAALRATGSPQVAGPGAPLSQAIGTRPDLEALIARLGL